MLDYNSVNNMNLLRRLENTYTSYMDKAIWKNSYSSSFFFFGGEENDFENGWWDHMGMGPQATRERILVPNLFIPT